MGEVVDRVSPLRLVLQIPVARCTSSNVGFLKRAFLASPGPTPILLRLYSDRGERWFRLSYRVTVTPQLWNALTEAGVERTTFMSRGGVGDG